MILTSQCLALDVINELELNKLRTILSSDMNTNDSVEVERIVISHLEMQKTGKDDVISAVSDFFYGHNDQRIGLNYFSFLEKLAIGDNNLKGEINYHLGRSYNYLSDKTNAKHHLNISQKNVSKPVLLSKIKMELAQINLKSNELELGEQNALGALILAEKFFLPNELLFSIHQLLSVIYTYQLNITKADYHITKVNFYANLIDSTEYHIKANIGNAGIYLNTGRLKMGRAELNKINENDIQSKKNNFDFYYYNGFFSLAAGEFLNSINYFNQSILNTEGVPLVNVAMGHTWLAEAYSKYCFFDKSIFHVKKAIDIYLKTPEMYSMYLFDNYKDLGYYYYETGDLQKSLHYFLLSKQYSGEDLKNNIISSESLIFIYGELLKDDYSAESMDALISIMNQTHQYLLHYNSTRHYIVDDNFREVYSRRFYKASLETLYHLHRYTGHQLIANRILDYTCMMSSLIYHNNKIKFDPLFGTNASNEEKAMERELRQTTSSFANEYSACKALEGDIDISNKLYYLDSLRILEKKYDEFMMTKLPTNSKIFFDIEMPSSLISEVQQSLETEEIIVCYFDYDNHLYSTVISKDELFFYKKEFTNEGAMVLNTFKETVANPDFSNQIAFQASKDKYTKTAQQAYDILLGKEIETLPFKPKHLIVIGDKLVHSLPLNALLTEKVSQEAFRHLPYTIRMFSIAYDFSLQSFLKHRLRKRKSRTYSYVGFAPDYNNKRIDKIDQVSVSRSGFENSKLVTRGELLALPAAKQGVLNTAKKYKYSKAIVGYSATKDNAINYFGKADILQFALHAIANEEKPELSQLVFSGNDEESNLFAYELFDLNTDTELTMLSACDTGKGISQSGKSVQSISQAFSFAGSSSLTMSYFKIPDEQTAAIDDFFITNLKKGSRIDEALRLSNIEYLNKTSEKYAHPFYWSGMALLGKTEPLRKPSFLR